MNCWINRIDAGQPAGQMIGGLSCHATSLYRVYKFLCDQKIESPKELLSFQEHLTGRISELEQQRYVLRLRLRRVKSPEAEAALKAQAKEIAKEITPLRKQRKIALRIAEHIPQIQGLLDAERQIEMKHNNLTRKQERSYYR